MENDSIYSMKNGGSKQGVDILTPQTTLIYFSHTDNGELINKKTGETDLSSITPDNFFPLDRVIGITCEQNMLSEGENIPIELIISEAVGGKSVLSSELCKDGFNIHMISIPSDNIIYSKEITGISIKSRREIVDVGVIPIQYNYMCEAENDSPWIKQGTEYYKEHLKIPLITTSDA